MTQIDSRTQKIQNGETKVIEIGFLPEGIFQLPISFSKQSDDVIKFKISILSQNKSILEQEKSISEKNGTILLNFTITNKGWGKKIIIESTSLKHVRLSIPISPKLQTKAQTSTINKSISKEISQEIKIFRSLSQSSKTFQYLDINDSQSKESQLNLTQLKVFFDQTYFKGLLSYEEAAKQLDYVIHNKLFSQGKNSFVNRLKRKIYRRFTISLYALLTKNSIRKIQMVKLYKNYINTNVLADNYHSK